MAPDSYRPPVKGDIIRIQYADGSEPERQFLVMGIASDGVEQTLDLFGDPENPSGG